MNDFETKALAIKLKDINVDKVIAYQTPYQGDNDRNFYILFEYKDMMFSSLFTARDYNNRDFNYIFNSISSIIEVSIVKIENVLYPFENLIIERSEEELIGEVVDFIQFQLYCINNVIETEIEPFKDTMLIADKIQKLMNHNHSFDSIFLTIMKEYGFNRNKGFNFE